MFFFFFLLRGCIKLILCHVRSVFYMLLFFCFFFFVFSTWCVKDFSTKLVLLLYYNFIVQFKVMGRIIRPQKCLSATLNFYAFGVWWRVFLLAILANLFFSSANEIISRLYLPWETKHNGSHSWSIWNNIQCTCTLPGHLTSFYIFCGARNAPTLCLINFV